MRNSNYIVCTDFNNGISNVVVLTGLISKYNVYFNSNSILKYYKHLTYNQYYAGSFCLLM